MKYSRFLLISLTVCLNISAFGWSGGIHNDTASKMLNYWTISPFLSPYGLSASNIASWADDADNSPYHDTYEHPQWEEMRDRLYIFDSKWANLDETKRLAFICHVAADCGVASNHSPANEVCRSDTKENLLEARVATWSSIPNVVPYTGTIWDKLNTFHDRDLIPLAQRLNGHSCWKDDVFLCDTQKDIGWKGLIYGESLGQAVLLDYFLAKENTVANPGGVYSVNPGGSVAFNGSGSYDPDSVTTNADGSYYQNWQGITSYLWDLNNDGTYDVSGATPSLSYDQLYSLVGPTEGKTVTLRVVDNEGSTYLNSGVGYATTTLAVYTPPVARANGGYGVNPGGTVGFSSSGSVDPDGGNLSYTWTIGNSSFTTANPALTHDQLLSIVGATEGTNIQLQVTDNEGVTASSQSTVAVYVPPTAEGRCYYGWMGEPNSVPSEWDWDNLVDNGSVDPDHSANPSEGIVLYEWDLDGDGQYELSGGSTQRVTYADFSSAYFYGYGNENQTVTLRVTDNEGVQTIKSGIRMPVLVNPTAEAGGDYGCNRGGLVTLAGSGTDPDGGAITAWSWDLNNDGTYETTGSILNLTYDQLLALGLKPGQRNLVSLLVTDNDSSITGWWSETAEDTAILKMFPGLAGDANVDGLVNFSDYLLLSTHFMQSSDWYGGDFNLDGTVDFSDYLLLSQHFGQTGGLESAGQSVPEPLTLGLLIVGAWIGNLSRKK